MINIIDAFEKQLFDHEYRPRTSHYASDVSGCRRALFYKWNEHAEGDKKSPERTNPPDASALIKMEMGNKLHEMIQDIFTKEHHPDVRDFEAEVSGSIAHPELRAEIHVRADGVFIDDEGKKSGAEIKTSFGRGISTIAKTRVPKPDHVEQCIVTMKALKLDRMYMFYLGRDNAYRCQFVLDFDKDDFVDASFVWPDGSAEVVYRHDVRFQDLVGKLISLETYLKNDELPPRDFIVAIKNGEIRDSYQHQKVMYKSDWQCSYCSWKEHCWADIVQEFPDTNNSEDFNIRAMGETK